MTVKKLVISILIAVVVGVVAEYIMRKLGVANLGGTVGGLSGIVAAMLMNKRK